MINNISLYSQNYNKNFQTTKHQECANLASDTIKDKRTDKLPNNYQRLYTVKNDETGFASAIYKEKATDEIIISLRCTNNRKGVQSDIQMVENKLPDQFKDAEETYQIIKALYPDKKITLVGYSLGGSLAQLLASKHEETQAITFSAFGANTLVHKYKNLGFKNNNNCINYTTSNDIVASAKPQIGETRTMKLPNNTKENPHSIENYNDLDNAKYLYEPFVDLERKEMSIVTNMVGKVAKVIPMGKDIIPMLFFSK